MEMQPECLQIKVYWDRIKLKLIIHPNRRTVKPKSTKNIKNGKVKESHKLFVNKKVYCCQIPQNLSFFCRINPVLGCYEAPKPNPLEGMSEEQKEYEAMKLVGLMDQLQRYN